MVSRTMASLGLRLERLHMDDRDTLPPGSGIEYHEPREAAVFSIIVRNVIREEIASPLRWVMAVALTGVALGSVALGVAIGNHQAIQELLP